MQNDFDITKTVMNYLIDEISAFCSLCLHKRKYLSDLHYAIPRDRHGYSHM